MATAGAMTPGRPARMTSAPGGVHPWYAAQSTARSPAVAQVPAAPPRPPETLTTGIPTPDEIDRQKDGYAKSIDKQFHTDADALSKTHQHYTDFLYTQAEQTKAQMILAIDQQVKQQELMMSQKYNEQLMMLHQAAQKQRTELEQQANCLSLEYHTRKTQEEFLSKQYTLEKERYDSQMKLANEMQKMCPTSAPGSVQAPAMPPMSTSMPLTPATMPVSNAYGVSQPRSTSWVPPPMPPPMPTAGTLSPMPSAVPPVQAMTVALSLGMAPDRVSASSSTSAPMGSFERTIPEQLDRVFEKFSRQASSTTTFSPSGMSGASRHTASSHSLSPDALSMTVAGPWYAPPAAIGSYNAVYGAPTTGSTGAMARSLGSASAAVPPIANMMAASAVSAVRSTIKVQGAKAEAGCPSCGSLLGSVRQRSEEANKYAKPLSASTPSVSLSSSMQAAPQAQTACPPSSQPPTATTEAPNVCPPSPQLIAVGVEAFQVAPSMTDLPAVQARNHLDASIRS